MTSVLLVSGLTPVFAAVYLQDVCGDFDGGLIVHALRREGDYCFPENAR